MHHTALIKWAAQKPRTVFLLDAIGAATSAFLLGVVLVHFQSFFGIPINVLYILAVVPLGFVIYDIAVMVTQPEKYSFLLTGIAVLNISYCILSLSLIGMHWQSATVFGWLYIIGEIMIVMSLAIFQLNVARLLKSRTSDNL